jgi:ribosomal protein S18 acetylase RimI-like enzyme
VAVCEKAARMISGTGDPVEVALKNTTGEGAHAIRPMSSSDIPFCIAQTGREGWTSTSDDFAVHLAHDPEGCFVATIGEKPAGMVTSTRYRVTGWIGNLIVPPEYRGKGLGSELMERAIARLESRGTGTIRLEADPLGIGIYRRLGFMDEYTSPRFRLNPGLTVEGPSVARVVGADIPAIASFDAPHFGDDRNRLLALLLAKARATFRVPRRGAIAGYLMVLPGVHGLRIGPWVAEGPQAARELLQAAVAFVGDQTMTLAVPGPNRLGQDMVREAGFGETPSSLRMVRGAAAGRGRPENIYALANGAIG